MTSGTERCAAKGAAAARVARLVPDLGGVRLGAPQPGVGKARLSFPAGAERVPIRLEAPQSRVSARWPLSSGSQAFFAQRREGAKGARKPSMRSSPGMPAKKHLLPVCFASLAPWRLCASFLRFWGQDTVGWPERGSLIPLVSNSTTSPVSQSLHGPGHVGIIESRC